MRKILSNQRGVALLMIMTAILFLTVIYGDFTFDSKISRLKATNIMDRAQAKLLAESGLQMAMTRLRLYKEAYNTIQNNQNLKNAVPAQLLNQLWEVPYIFPVPVGKDAGRVVKDSIDKFMKESVMDGEIRVNVQNISNRLNLNMLRYDMQKIAAEAQAGEDQDDQYRQNGPQDYTNQNQFSVDQALYTTMKRLVDEKKDKDDAFNDRYGNLNYQVLFTNLKYYASDYGTLNRDPLLGEAEQTFQKIPMTPKYGPMTSASELYMVPGWDDQLIELIQNEFSVYPTTQIDLNKITGNFLKILFPQLTDDDVAEFFKAKNDTNNPKFFNSIGDLKNYWVNTERRMSDSDFDARVKVFEAKGITFGSNPNLFKVISEGIFNRSTYTLVATVVLPTQETTPQTSGQTSGSGSGSGQSSGSGSGQTSGSGSGQTSGSGSGQGSGQNQSGQLLEPRIIEIQVN